MKSVFTVLLLSLAGSAFAQSAFPDILSGTWKVKNQEIYEHWDKLNDQSWKGFSYEIKNGTMSVSEYLDIEKKESKLIYRATVLRQNEGLGVEFKLTGSDSAFIFENPEHDFPKKIIYRKISANELFVEVTDGAKRGFSYTMTKQTEGASEQDTTTSNPDYDDALAKQLGSDDYGMKSYVFVMLKTGSNKSTDKAWINERFRGHLDNIDRLVAQGKLIVAGPFGENEKGYRGIFLLNRVSTPEEARELLQSDPAIRDGLLDAEIYTWYGSAALPLYLESAGKIWKQKP